MNGIGAFLERYKNFVPPRLAASRAVRAAIQEIVGVDVGEKDVTIQNGCALIRTEGLQKAEIIMRKEEVLAAVRVKIGDSVKNIR